MSPELADAALKLGVEGFLLILFVVYMSSDNRRRERKEDADARRAEVREERDFSFMNKLADQSAIQFGLLNETLTEVKSMSKSSESAFRDMFSELRDITKKRCIDQMEQCDKFTKK